MTVAASSRWVLIASTVLATMLYTIDSTIVNVALPHMQGSLQATQDQAAWILTSYIVIGAICTPLTGWLGTRYGLRRVLLVSVAGFTLSSALCGIATGLGEMVAFRTIQGGFGAALVPLAQVVLLQEFPREQHGRVTALWGMGVVVGPVIGPTLGGWLTDAFSWRWAFLINVPVGLIAYLGLAATLAKRGGDQQRPFDMLGFVFLSLALGLFQLMIDRGQTSDWFEATEIVAYAFGAAVALYMFFAHSLTTRHAFVDLSLFRDRNFALSLGVMFAIGITLLSPAVLLPSFLQQLQGYTPTAAGELVAARGVAAFFGMLTVGRLIGRVDLRVTMSVGIAFSVAALALMAHFSLETPRHLIVLGGILQGLGTPFTFVPLSVAAYATLPAVQRAEAGTMLTLLRNIGSSIGVSATIALLARSTQVNQSYLAEHFTAYSTQRWAEAGTLPGANEGTGMLVGELSRQAAAIGYSNDFYLLAAATMLAFPLVFALRKPRADTRVAASAADAGH